MRHCKRHLFAALIALLLLAGHDAFAQRVTGVNLSQSSIKFVSKQMNVPVEGKFAKFALQLTFDAAKPSEGHVLVELELASIDTGSEEANEEVKGKGWFDVQRFPTARFVSSSVRSSGPGRYEASGKLTIKGRTKNVVVPFAFKTAEHLAVFDGAFALKRLDYGIGQGVWSDTDTVADEVEIKFHITANAETAK